MSDNIIHFGFGDDYQPTIREQASDLAEMALERIDDQHGNALGQLLDQLGAYISDRAAWARLNEAIMNTAAVWSLEAARAAAETVADACERRYQAGC